MTLVKLRYFTNKKVLNSKDMSVYTFVQEKANPLGKQTTIFFKKKKMTK